MAELAIRYTENVNGKYFVDEMCIDCDACRQAAPTNFARHEDTGYSYVFKQPKGELEEQECAAAMEGCPVDAIGDFGEDCCGTQCGCH